MYGQSSRIYFFCLCLVAVVVACATGAKVKVKVKVKVNSKDADRITNGQNATIEQFPQIVQIVDKYVFNSPGFLCAGTLISDRHVVSAAHCFKEYGAGDLGIIANATYLKGDVGGIKRNVSAIYTHPKYNEETDDYDLVVIEVSEPMTFHKGVQQAEMCSESWKDNEKIIVAGWGRIAENASDHSNQLQMVKVDTLSNETCKRKYRDLTEKMICSIVGKGKDACQGDSGGPAFYNGQLCGVVSFGFGCGRDGAPAVFASIPQLSDFIAEKLKNNA